MAVLRLNFSNIRGDIFGGVTAGIVALPLALAFGVASGLGPIAGLWGAILVGFFASLFGGTESQVSGPTGPMVVVTAGLVASIFAIPGLEGRYDLIFTAILLAGVMQIAAGALKFGDYIRLVPYPVVSGFMSGIGCIIIILQLSPALGHAAPPGTINALMFLPEAAKTFNYAALALAALTLFIVFKWPAKWGKWMPGPLAALVICTVVSLFMPAVPIIGDIPTGFPAFQMPTVTADTAMIIIQAAVVLAALGAIDSLLTSLVADNVTRTRHNSNRELVGQGVGNALAGLFGGLAGAGATMRTVVNIRAGGRTRLSGMFHSLLLVAVVLGLGSLASHIPHAVLAGILIKVGIDIVDWRYLRSAHRGPRWDLLLMVLVLGLTVFVNLITAVVAGVVLAALAFVKQVADRQLENMQQGTSIGDTSEERALLASLRDRAMLFDFGGPLSFGAAADMGHRVRERTRKDTQVLLLDFSRVPFIDVSAARAVETIADDAVESRKQVFVCGMSDEVKAVLDSLNANRNIPADRYYENRMQALEAAAELVKTTA